MNIFVLKKGVNKMIELIQKIDKDIINFIYNNLQHEAVNKGMSFITSLGNYGFIWILLLCIAFMSKKHRKIACISACAFLLSRLIGVHFLKPLISRPRPFHELQYIDIFISKPTSYSFPSGHAISSFSTVWPVVKQIEQIHLKAVLIIFASLIALSRIYLMVHYPSDVFAGIALGILCGHSALFIFKDTTLIYR